MYHATLQPCHWKSKVQHCIDTRPYISLTLYPVSNNGFFIYLLCAWYHYARLWWFGKCMCSFNIVILTFTYCDIHNSNIKWGLCDLLTTLHFALIQWSGSEHPHFYVFFWFPGNYIQIAFLHFFYCNVQVLQLSCKSWNANIAIYSHTRESEGHIKKARNPNLHFNNYECKHV